MAKLTMLSNRISEIQEKNLKMYPFVFFEAVSGVIVNYDLSNSLDMESETNKGEIKYGFNEPKDSHLRVSYYLKLDTKLNANEEKRFMAIENAVRSLFWKQVKVEVYFNEKLVYKSKT